MFPTSTYYRRYYNDWYDRPSQTMNLLDDPFFFSRTSNLPYYLRPRRLSTLDSVEPEKRIESSETVTKTIGNGNNSQAYPNAADEKTGLAEMSNQKDKFTVNVDVSHFAPDEIQVKKFWE